MRPVRRTLILLVLAALAVACNRPVAALQLPVVQLGPGGPGAWIDAPLNGMHLPLAPYEVVFHLTDDTAVAGGELLINGESLPGLAEPEPGQRLATVRQVWNPTAPGEYTLIARVRNAAGQWAESVPVVVTVGDVTRTPTPGTITPTLTPTFTPTLTPTPGQGFGPPELSSPGFYHGAGSCDPMEVTLRVGLSAPAKAKVVVVFTRLLDESTGEAGDWSDGSAMAPVGDGRYQITLRGNSLATGSTPPKVTVLYQFVAQLEQGPNVRSPVYNDLVLGTCGVILLPIQINPFPLVPTTPAPPIVK